MALSKPVLTALIVAEMTAAGFDPTNEHARLALLAAAIANAVVDHIALNAEAVVATGSSSGSWPVL